MNGRNQHGLGWLLDDLVERVPKVTGSVVLSTDGLTVGADQWMSRENSEQLAAVASGLHSLAKGMGAQFDAGDVRQTMVELDRAFAFVTAAGHGSCLAVLTDADADIGLVAYEMALLVKRVGPHLASDPRDGADPAADGATRATAVYPDDGPSGD